MKNIIYVFLSSIILMACNTGKGDVSGTEANVKSPGRIKTGINIGERAPELVFKSPDGENISLSSLRGKVVLIDFWASWCSPCRMEHPHLINTYRHFKDKLFLNGKGFTIYGVSLDKTREAWVSAIKNDGLEWETQVSDLKGTQSVPAAMYGVMGIPMNFLIDGDGIIVAKGLRGEYLDNKLKELLK
jgi:thiol-disulfide isomerase/thioredoxin